MVPALGAILEGPERWSVRPVAELTVDGVKDRKIGTLFGAIWQLDASSTCRPVGRHAKTMAAMVEESGAAGNLVHDAHIAALCIEHGVSELLTADCDFARFPQVRTVNPFTTR
jgi:predicted nucleic acid-binding protein